jgi:hypothetical protein
MFRQCLCHIDMGGHCQRMDAGIGTPCGVQRDQLPGHSEQRLLQRFLNRRPVILPLPAQERAAVKFDGKAPAGH